MFSRKEQVDICNFLTPWWSWIVISQNFFTARNSYFQNSKSFWCKKIRCRQTIPLMTTNILKWHGSFSKSFREVVNFSYFFQALEIQFPSFQNPHDTNTWKQFVWDVLLFLHSTCILCPVEWTIAIKVELECLPAVRRLSTSFAWISHLSCTCSLQTNISIRQKRYSNSIKHIHVHSFILKKN